MKLGIDVRTKDQNALIRRLKPLAATVSVEDGGKYYEDPHYAQVHLATTWTMADLDDWLYTLVDIDYVGSFSRETA